jgi:hypothetical protein
MRRHAPVLAVRRPFLTLAVLTAGVALLALPAGMSATVSGSAGPPAMDRDTASLSTPLLAQDDNHLRWEPGCWTDGADLTPVMPEMAPDDGVHVLPVLPCWSRTRDSVLIA